MPASRFKLDGLYDVFPIHDTKKGVSINKEGTVVMLNQFSKENEKLKYLLQLCVNDMYSSTGKIKKSTARKLMQAIRVDLVEFPD